MIIKKLVKYWRFIFQVRFVFIANLIIFIFLLARNPFSERTLIPNLEPYPDTIHYTLPPRSLVMGGPFMIYREDRSARTSVGPLYSLTLIPFYLINHDVRMFYFANVLMSLVSLWLLFLILKKITEDKLVVGLTLFLFVTNYFNYWFPQWAMAENLLMPIFFFGVWLLMSKPRIGYVFGAALVTVAFYATKKACAPLTIVFAIMYLLKLLVSKNRFKNTMWFVLFSVVIFLPLLWYQITYIGGNPLEVFSGLFSHFSKSGQIASVVTPTSVGNAWFSMKYLTINLPLYLKALVGDRARFLWDFTPVVSRWVGVLGLFGLFTAIFVRRFRLISVTLIFLLLGEILFMSVFYAFDMRYVYHAIPTLLLGFAILMSLSRDFFERKRMSKVFVCLVVIIFGTYFLKNAVRLKSQIMINVKYAETPWYYISVLKLNDFFTKEKVVNDNKPIVISPMPPYYIDYYSNGNYELLPLSNDQEFRHGMNETWGTRDYSDLFKIYRDYLKSGRSLYVSTYGLGNEAYLHKSFDNLRKTFMLEEVYDGCYTQCKIYQVKISK